MKKIISKIFILSIIFIVISLFSTKTMAEKKKIGILQWSTESRYSDSKEGFIKKKKKEGFTENEVEFITELADANKVKAMKIAQKFAAYKLTMYYTIGTSAAVALANEIKDTPIIFSTVYDPVESKISLGWQNSGNNTTGSSSYVPMPRILEVLKKLKPIKNIGVLYTPGQTNSEAQLKNLQKSEQEFNIKVIPIPIKRKEEVKNILSFAAEKVEAIYVSGSGIMDETIPEIVEITSKSKTITFTHLEDPVTKGVLFGLSADPREMGRLAGKKAAMVLRGAKPSDIPIEPLKNFNVILNQKTIKSGQFKIPPDFMKLVTKTIE
ncbi:ABC transporter substrate-binding protein [Candidatus Desantisbacteria bacterium]|nr:ABC transporter substrate-binding protein [Candidatus Desantisbacteria bacterium]